MVQGLFLSFLLVIFVFVKSSFGSSFDWYSYYIQCVATSSQESNCYEAIREYLSTEEGKQQAQEVGFKRQQFRDSGQVASQAVVILTRIQQMEAYLLGAVEKAKDENDPVRTYCISEKNLQMVALRKNVEEKKNSLLSRVNQANAQLIEEDYQLILSLNSRANELYLQARKCLE